MGMGAQFTITVLASILILGTLGLSQDAFAFTQGVCGQTVTLADTVGGVLTLTQDLSCTNSDGIFLQNGVTLDCAGKTIALVANDGTTKSGIRGSASGFAANDVTIQNCVVDGFTDGNTNDFSNGILLFGTGNTIQDNTLQNNELGVRTGGDNQIIRSNLIQDNVVTGILVNTGDNILIESNTITQSGGSGQQFFDGSAITVGFFGVGLTTNVSILNNDITTTSPRTASIWFFVTGSGTLIQDNTVTQAGPDGLVVIRIEPRAFSINNVQILDNVVNLSDPDGVTNAIGIQTAGSFSGLPLDTVTIARNTINFQTNGGTGIAVADLTNPQIVDNVITGIPAVAISFQCATNSLVSGNTVASQALTIIAGGNQIPGCLGHGNNIYEDNIELNIPLNPNSQPSVLLRGAPNDIVRNNEIGRLSLDSDSDNVIIHDNTLSKLILDDTIDGLQFYHNDLDFVQTDGPIPLSVNGEGNYWKTSRTGVYAPADPHLFEANFDSNRCDTFDRNPYDSPIAGLTTGFGQTLPPLGINFIFSPDCGISVIIDIKPNETPNCFNNDGAGVLPVAILGSDTLDVSDIDPRTVMLESLDVRTVGKNNKLQASIEDVNGDGFDDMVVQINDQDGLFESGETTAVLTGELFDGTNIIGSDSICIVP